MIGVISDSRGKPEKTLNQKIKKKWQAYYIAPLQPPTLAVFRPWGSSAGAGRVRPAGAKIRKQDKSQNLNS